MATATAVAFFLGVGFASSPGEATPRSDWHFGGRTFLFLHLLPFLLHCLHDASQLETH